VDDIDRAIRRIRTSIFALRGSLVAGPGDGLRQRILEIASDVTPVLGFPPAVAFAGLVDAAGDEALAEDVIACVRESLTNVGRHAAASAASLDVEVAGDQLLVRVVDNGVGMPEHPSRSSGIANLRARAENRRGSLLISPNPGGGTVLEWRVAFR
jgi:signal transduction histidine kinase